MTKHTEGEWVSLGYRVDVDVADGLSGICEMSDWMSEEEMEANAKLIAAAPELLRTIQEALRISDLWTMGENTSTEHEQEAIALANMKREFEQAIKKATA